MKYCNTVISVQSAGRCRFLSERDSTCKDLVVGKRGRAALPEDHLNEAEEYEGKTRIHI